MLVELPQPKRILIVEHDVTEADRLNELCYSVIKRYGSGRRYYCEISRDIVNALEIIKKGAYFLLTNIDLGAGLWDEEQTGVKVVRFACTLEKHDRHRMCIYGEEFPDWIPLMSGVTKIPKYRLNEPYLTFFLRESSISPN